MEKKYTSILDNSFIWFGAGVSIAEIMTGTYLADLGMKKGILAILIGHIIGCFLLFVAGVIGGQTRKSSMETVKFSFGQKGSLFFALLNILQLVGWTAIMIYDGAIAANGRLGVGHWIGCLVIGILIIVWLLIGINSLGKVSLLATIALFIMSIVLSRVIFINKAVAMPLGEGISFGAAIELSIAMPLSWLPLISDYTKEAKEPVKASFFSSLVYGLVSSWMYIIGMGAAIYTGESNIATILVRAGLGVMGLLIIVFSTVTTTFMDAYSAGISSETISEKLKGKHIAIVVSIIGIIAAIIYPMDNITNFLYVIGSVFAPMIAVQIVDYYFIKRDNSKKEISVLNIIVWLLGFIIYRYLMNVNLIIGNTIPSMLITIILALVLNKIFSKRLDK